MLGGTEQDAGDTVDRNAQTQSQNTTINEYILIQTNHTLYIIVK